MYSETQNASTGSVLRIAANPTRREILRHLHATDSRTVDVDDLAEALESRDRSTEYDTSRTVIELRHMHLPMLADENIITYDRGSDVVAYRGDDRLEALLEFISERLE